MTRRVKARLDEAQVEAVRVETAHEVARRRAALAESARLVAARQHQVDLLFLPPRGRVEAARVEAARVSVRASRVEAARVEEARLEVGRAESYRLGVARFEPARPKAWNEATPWDEEAASEAWDEAACAEAACAETARSHALRAPVRASESAATPPQKATGGYIRHGESGFVVAGEARLPPRRGASLDTLERSTAVREESPKLAANTGRESERSRGVGWWPLLDREGMPCRDHSLPMVALNRRFSSRWAFTSEVVKALKEAAIKLPHGKTRTSLLRKATWMPSCGAQLAGFACPEAAPVGAGFDAEIVGFIEGSGRLTGPKKCGVRCCPYCAKAAAVGESRRLARAIELLPRRKGWGLKLLTFTAWRDPSLHSAHTADALRSAIVALFSGWRNCWKFLSKCRSSAAYAAIEISDGGHVHLHVLAFTPFVVRRHLATLFAEGHNAQNAGSFRWAVARDGQCLDLRSANKGSVHEVCKYICKGASPLDEAWLAGEASRETLHPTLLARWDQASAGKQLRRPYGALKGLMAADTEPEKEAGHLLPAICPECGASGHDHYREVVFTDAKAAVRALHKRGMRALRGSWWRPPNPDDADDGLHGQVDLVRVQPASMLVGRYTQNTGARR